ncbi:serine/threonine-protein kinase WNK2-like isoform X3 [Gopherus evgoodei]|uniref:serine/threonine-protein kinase WNK2-like isoform X2 n=1 Tax=Gopherus evgoodei TaxID=1825980 RepID=UPI0011CF5591|nr:serine/threonine-protein kinase WNK2-like isoform X2 [Gopherus evgoodei]XP_030426647.1 serine/threonine-protein kinase WNK2-like isoform X3 [Gopherus evgoodei]
MAALDNCRGHSSHPCLGYNAAWGGPVGTAPALPASTGRGTRTGTSRRTVPGGKEAWIPPRQRRENAGQRRQRSKAMGDWGTPIVGRAGGVSQYPCIAGLIESVLPHPPRCSCPSAGHLHQYIGSLPCAGVEQGQVPIPPSASLLPLQRPMLEWSGAEPGLHSPLSLTPSLAAPCAGVELGEVSIPPSASLLPLQRPVLGWNRERSPFPLILTPSPAAPRAGVEQGEVPIPHHPHSFPCSAPCWGGTGRGPHSPSSSLLPLQRPVLGWNRGRSLGRYSPFSALCWGGAGADPWVAIPPSAPRAGVEQGQIPGSLFPLQRPVLGWNRERSPFPIILTPSLAAPRAGVELGEVPIPPSASLLPLQRPMLGWSEARSPFPPQSHSFPCSAQC